MAIHPEKYGVRLFVKSFEDYVKMSRSDRQIDWIGHDTKFLTREDIGNFLGDAREFMSSVPVPILRQA
jgi:hypothetical protein